MWIWFILWQIIGASLTNRLVKWLAVVTTVGLLTSHFPFFPISFHLSFVLHPLSLHSLFPLFPFISLWLVESIGMQGDVGWCLQGKDKAVISANEATLVPEHKCANISNTTRPCVCVCVCMCVWEWERKESYIKEVRQRSLSWTWMWYDCFFSCALSWLCNMTTAFKMQQLAFFLSFFFF